MIPSEWHLLSFGIGACFDIEPLTFDISRPENGRAVRTADQRTVTLSQMRRTTQRVPEISTKQGQQFLASLFHVPSRKVILFVVVAEEVQDAVHQETIHRRLQ